MIVYEWVWTNPDFWGHWSIIRLKRVPQVAEGTLRCKIRFLESFRESVWNLVIEEDIRPDGFAIFVGDESLFRLVLLPREG